MPRGGALAGLGVAVLVAGCGPAGSTADDPSRSAAATEPSTGSTVDEPTTGSSATDEPTTGSSTSTPAPTPTPSTPAASREPTGRIGYPVILEGGMGAIVVEADGSRVTELTMAEMVGWVSVAPDGQRLAAEVGVDQATGGGGPLRVQPQRGWQPADVAGHHRAPSWSPDSRRIAFTADPIASWECTPGSDNEPLPDVTLTVVDDVSGDVVQQLPVPRDITRLAWSPDGRALAWFAQPGFQPCDGGAPDGAELAVLEVETGEVTRRPMSAVNTYHPVVWSPDGRSLAIRGDTADGPPDLLRVAAFDADRQPTRLAAAPGVPVAWTAHGVVARVDRPTQPDPQTQLLAVDADTGTATDIVTLDGEVESLVVLDDGHLAVTTITLDFGGCDVTNPDAHCDTAATVTSLHVIDPSTGDIGQIVADGINTHFGGLSAIDPADPPRG